jgi:hypothetical protein
MAKSPNNSAHSAFAKVPARTLLTASRMFTHPFNNTITITDRQGICFPGHRQMDRVSRFAQINAISQLRWRLGSRGRAAIEQRYQKP